MAGHTAVPVVVWRGTHPFLLSYGGAHARAVACIEARREWGPCAGVLLNKSEGIRFVRACLSRGLCVRVRPQGPECEVRGAEHASASKPDTWPGARACHPPGYAKHKRPTGRGRNAPSPWGGRVAISWRNGGVGLIAGGALYRARHLPMASGRPWRGSDARRAPAGRVPGSQVTLGGGVTPAKLWPTVCGQCSPCAGNDVRFSVVWSDPDARGVSHGR